MYDQAGTEATLRAMGSQFDPSVMMKTRELFRAPVAAAEWAPQEPIADLAYGEHERHKLDLYTTGSANAPVLLFVHGGGFVAGDKAGDALFYGNVARYFAHHGYLAAAMNYRLAPGHCWPSGSEDVAAALDWLARNAAAQGGDPDRIVVLGQSAGAAHTAGVLFDDRFTYPAGVRAAALLSGFYEANDTISGGPLMYFGEESGQWPDRSPSAHVKPGHVPLLLGVAELDPAPIASQTFVLAQALTQADGRPPRVQWFENQNHVSAVHSLGLGRDPVGSVLRDFFDRAIG